MKKTLKKFANKEIYNIKSIKGGDDSKKPVDTSGTDLAKAKNRRVTFKLL